jgi:dTMP kinase
MFLTLEGPEGSGKTTQLRLLAESLRAAGHAVHATREPGGTAIGDQIREVLFDHGNRAMRPRTEILLFLASRAQHTDEVIRPRLAAGEIVLCDRYRDSTVAYQGYGHGVDISTLHQLNDFATGNLLPDLTLLLDLDPAAGLHRRAAEGGWNRLDAYDLRFHARVRQGYLQLAAAEPARWAVVDASRSVDAVQAGIRSIVMARLAQKAS